MQRGAAFVVWVLTIAVAVESMRNILSGARAAERPR
jgi:hypothetical protein